MGGTATSTTTLSKLRANTPSRWPWIVLLVLFALVAAAGWYLAITRGSTLAGIRGEAAASQAERAVLTQQNEMLRANVAGLSKELQSAQAAAPLPPLPAPAVDRTAEITALEQQLVGARSRADTAEASLQALQQSRAEAPAAAMAQATAPPAPPRPAQPSNINPPVQSDVAPRLPVPPLPPNAPVRAFLSAAQEAIQAGRTGEAQSALERAEVRLLNRNELTGADPARPGPPGDQPGDQLGDQPGVSAIEAALTALGAGDTAQALRVIDGLLADARLP